MHRPHDTHGQLQTPTRTHHCGARCTVVAKAVDRYTSWEEEEPQATQKEHSEHLSIEARVRRRGASQEWKSFQKTTLRPGERNVGEAKPHCRVKEESVGFSGRLALPTKAPWTKILASGYTSGRMPFARASQSGARKPILQLIPGVDCPFLMVPRITTRQTCEHGFSDCRMTQPHHVQHPPNWPSMKLVSLVHSSNQ